MEGNTCGVTDCEREKEEERDRETNIMSPLDPTSDPPRSSCSRLRRIIRNSFPRSGRNFTPQGLIVGRKVYVGPEGKEKVKEKVDEKFLGWKTTTEKYLR